MIAMVYTSYDGHLSMGIEWCAREGERGKFSGGRKRVVKSEEGARRLTQLRLCLLPVRRVFAYPRHDQDPICIAPMKLLPCYSSL